MSLPDPNRPAPPRAHLAYLDGLRGLAALFVLIHHAYIQVWNIFAGKHAPGRAQDLMAWMIYGHFAVSVFIVLSGFCLMLPIARGDGTLRGGALLFFKKRARRILPPYYFALLISMGIALLAPRTGVHITPFSVLTHLLLAHNLFPNVIGGINGAFWSIAVEWQIYFLFPLLVLAWQRFGSFATTIIATTLAYTVSFLLRPTSYAGLTPHYVALFVFGMLGSALAFTRGAAWDRWRERFPWRGALALLTLVLFTWCARLGWVEALGPLQTTTDIGVGLCAMLLLIVASSPNTNRIRQVLSLKPIVQLGEFPYSLYLIHLPLLQLCWFYIVRPLHLPSLPGFALLLFGGGPLILAAARLFYFTFERPFLSPTAKLAPTNTH